MNDKKFMVEVMLDVDTFIRAGRSQGIVAKHLTKWIKKRFEKPYDWICKFHEHDGYNTSLYEMLVLGKDVKGVSMLAHRSSSVPILYVRKVSTSNLTLRDLDTIIGHVGDNKIKYLYTPLTYSKYSKTNTIPAVYNHTQTSESNTRNLMVKRLREYLRITDES